MTDKPADTGPDAAHAPSNVPEAAPGSPDQDKGREAQTFDKDYVEKLRKEAAEARTKAKRADELAARLLEATIASATSGILADASDLRANVSDEDLLDDDGLPDPEKIKTAASELAQRKPHLADRRPAGNVDQGARPQPESVDLAGMIRGLAG